MPNFEGARKPRWEGQSDIAAEAIGEEALQKADELLAGSELELAEDNFRVRQIVHQTDPFAPLPHVEEKAAEILSENKTLDAAGFDQGKVASNDPRFDHVGTNMHTTTNAPLRQVEEKKEGFFKRLFGG